jgi:asparagine synthase (glutamine-hydrolysing)
MSGICGIVHFDGSPVDEELLSRMVQAAAYRGPDGIRFWADTHAGFAHLSLHITPESSRERLPLIADELVLTADARIDNREELSHSLKGYLPQGAPTDADLILAAYRRWGTDSPAHLVGDFSFAIWDQGRRQLFAARDPMAMRAFYYRLEACRLAFATEVKQILALPDVTAEIFEPAVAAHLAGPYGKADWTFYRGISQLPPAHALLVNSQGHRRWRYWDIDPEARLDYRQEGQYTEHFRELFKEAVRCRLRSIKPVGIFLSGGTDSGSVASTAGWLMQQGLANPAAFRAYCWAFETLPGCDERHISRGITDHYGIATTDIPADDAWPLVDYPEHGPDRDEPYIGVYQALTERTLAAAQEHGVRLMLTGDRGDEMVGDWVFDHLGLLRTGRWLTLWHELAAHGRWAGKPLNWVLKGYLLQPLLSTMRSGARRAAAPKPRYPDWVPREFARRVNLTDIIRECETQSEIGDFARRMRYRRVFFFKGLKHPLLRERYHAKFGMGFADPWSDRRIASFILAAPQWIVQRPSRPKRLAWEAMRGLMPEVPRQNAGKIEPGSLFDYGFKVRARETVLALITNSRAAARGYLDEAVLRSRYDAFLGGKPPRHDFWWPLTLEMWLRRNWA